MGATAQVDVGSECPCSIVDSFLLKTWVGALTSERHFRTIWCLFRHAFLHILVLFYVQNCRGFMVSYRM